MRTIRSCASTTLSAPRRQKENLEAEISVLESQVKALDGVSLEIKEGEIFGIYGADGAGKAPLERIMCTLCVPDSGSCSIFGFDIVKDRQEIRKFIGFVPSTFSLYPDLTVEENIKYHAGLFSLPFDEDDKMIAPIYRQLAPFSRRRAEQLSGGMKQKLALCCALIHKPRLLILDEPTTGIDTVSRREFIGCIKDLNKEFGTTVILSSPYRNELMMCSSIALLEKGRIVSLGNPLDILPPESLSIYDSAAIGYYWGKGCWWLFAVVGLGFCIASLLSDGVISAILGVIGFSCFWSILELFQKI